MSDDLGMIFMPKLGLFAKIHQDEKGEYILLPKHGKKKIYIKKT